MPSLGPVLGAVDFRSEQFVVPELSELFEWPAFGFAENWSIAGFSLALNRVAVLTLLAALFTCAFYFFAFRNPQVVPGRLQSTAETVIGFVREQIAIEAIGKEGVAFVPFLTALFTFIFIANVFEIVPLINFPVTSRMAVPAALSFLTYVTFVFIGFKKQGFRFLKDTLFPPGVPKPIYLILTPIELFSVFVIRPLTLAIRLFANLMAGHVLLTVFFLFTNDLIGSGLGTPLGVITLIVSVLLMLFELMVISIQAYIFTTLSAFYIAESLHGHGDHDEHHEEHEATQQHPVRHEQELAAA